MADSFHMFKRYGTISVFVWREKKPAGDYTAIVHPEKKYIL